MSSFAYIRYMLGLDGWLRKDTPSDWVVVLPVVDSSPHFRNTLMTWSMCFHDVLDADKLHNSLRDLIEIGNWRKLGGRLRLNAAGRVEVHIPHQFTSDRPAVHFTRAAYSRSVSKHPLCEVLPKENTRPYVLDIPQNHCEELGGPDVPKTFYDFDTTDRPALTLHIITFSDCTFVTLTLPHCLTDGMGLRELAVNCSRVLKGDTGSVSLMADPADDPAFRLSSMPESQQDEPYFWEHKMLRGSWTILFMYRFLADILFGPRNRQRAVVLPAPFITRLREEAHEDSPSIALSDSEIVTTWLIRLVCSHMSPSSRRPLAISSAVDPRGRVPESIIDPRKAYVSNLVVHAWTLTTAQDFLGRSLGHAAALFRQSISQHLRKPQLQSLIRLWYQSYSRSGALPVYTNPSSFLLTVSNLSRARFQDAADFKPAVVKRGLSSRSTGTPSGKPSWCLNIMHPQLALPGVVHIQGKDHDGNYWVLLSTNDKAWEKINEITMSSELD